MTTRERHHLISIEPCRLAPGGPLVDVVTVKVDSVTVVAVLPPIPDGASDAVREGIARRRLVVTSGQCPCGALLMLPDPRVQHEDDCPAVDAALLAALALR